MLNCAVYARRMRAVVEPLLLDANARALEAGAASGSPQRTSSVRASSVDGLRGPAVCDARSGASRAGRRRTRLARRGVVSAAMRATSASPKTPAMDRSRQTNRSSLSAPEYQSA